MYTGLQEQVIKKKTQHLVDIQTVEDLFQNTILIQYLSEAS